MQTAPVLFFFPPTTGANASPDGQPVRFDFLGPQSAEGIHGWLQRHMPPGEYPQLSRPFNWSKLITTVTIILGVFTFGTVAYPYIMPIIQNRNLWAVLSLIMVLMFTSGHMYNHIRKVPYVTGNGKGGITYFAGGFSNQFGIETQIIAAVCKSIFLEILVSATLTLARCRSFLRNYFSRPEGTSNEGRTKTADRGYYLDFRALRHVQLLDELVQNQERGIPILATPVLGIVTLTCR